MAKLTQTIVNSWLEAAWRDGFSKGETSAGSSTEGQASQCVLPNFADFDPRITNPESSKPTPEELSKLPFNPCLCSARMFKGSGFAVQCSRVHPPNGLYCKTHQKSADEAAKNGLNIRFGRYDEERPTHWLDKAPEDPLRQKIAWSDTKKSSHKKAAGTKNIKVKDLKEYLSTRLPNESLKGLKKPELEEMYHKEKELEKSESETESEEDTMNQEVLVPMNETDANSEEIVPAISAPGIDDTESTGPTYAPGSPAADSGDETEDIHDETENQGNETIDVPVEDPVKAAQAARLARLSSQVSQPLTLVEGIEDMEPEPEPESEPESEPELVPAKAPTTVAEYREFLTNAGVSIDGVKGARAFKELYQKHMENESSNHEEDDDDESDEDEREYVEIDYEGVEYLEDETSGEIFSINHKLLGQWGPGCEEIIWVDESARTNHESNKD